MADYLKQIEYFEYLNQNDIKPRNIKSVDKTLKILKEKLNCLITRISKEELELYYTTHSRPDTQKYFSLTNKEFTTLLKFYNIHKSQKDIKKLLKQTCIERYGVDNPQKCNTIKNKTRQTCLDKYGVTCVLKNDNIKNSIAKTNLSRYGTKNVFASKIIKDKIESTVLSRYGVKHTSQSNIMKVKAANTKLYRYGSSTYNNRDKAKQTCIERYSVKVPAQNKDIQSKMKQTCIENFGVDNPSKSREIAQKRANTRKSFVAIDGTHLDSSWEVLVYNYCIRNNIDIERNIPIKYQYNNKDHVTFIDFKIDGILFEIKGAHLLKGCFDYKLDVPIEVKLNIYKANNVILITNYKELFGKPSSFESNGLKYLNKCTNPLIGVDIELFNNPEFPYSINKPKCYYNVKVNGNMSCFEAFNTESIRWKMIKNRINYSGGFIDSKQILTALNVTRTCKQPSWFSKSFAKYIINKYITSEIVVDPFAGWGARYDASLELNKTYIGCDLNRELVDWHNSLGRNIEYGDAKTFTYANRCSVFICPPYQDIEKYFDTQDINTTQCEWLSIVMKNIPNAKEYVMVCKVVDPGWEKYIVEIKENKSHFGLNKEYVLKIDN